jgi:hypothetical protein
MPINRIVGLWLRPGEQRTLPDARYCGALKPSDWERVLRADGFDVETGETLQTLYGAMYGLRFRKPAVYGDIAVVTGDDLCITYTIRIQIGNKPQRWNGRFKIPPKQAAVPASWGTPPTYFTDDPTYPPFE